jgi:hypothetical protein
MTALSRQYKGKPGYGNGDAGVERLYGGLDNDLLNGGVTLTIFIAMMAMTRLTARMATITSMASSDMIS